MKYPEMSVRLDPGQPLYDDERRHAGEWFGFFEFAWRPRRCRNGKTRWLCWVERHADGTFTLGNRAY